MRELDCFIIGHNELGTAELHKQLSMQGVKSGSYKDFNLGFVTKPNGEEHLSLTELHNELVEDKSKVIREANTFNAAISYIGSYLSNRDLTFDYVTSVREEFEKLKDILQNTEIVTVAVLTTLYVTPNPIIEVIKLVKQWNPRAKIVVGGPFITTLCRTKDDEYINYVCTKLIHADYYINSSKGEEALKDLINVLKGKGDISKVKNLFYYPDGNLVKNEKETETQGLAENMVDWSLYMQDPKEFVNIRTAVSCPYACAFCGFPENAGAYSVTGVELVEKELKELIAFNPNLKSIYFIDDTFNVPKARFKDMLRSWIKNKFEFKWHSYLRCQHVDEETIELMAESNCEGVFLGIESGSDTILKNMNKQAKVSHYAKGIEMLKKANIMTFGAFIVGFPGENLKTFKETVDFIEGSGLDFFRSQMWFCEHITPIWRQRDVYNITGEGFEWTHGTMNSKVAASFVDRMFMDVKNSTWLPQHDFDYENVFRLLTNGLTVPQIKEVVQSFNKVILRKLKNPADTSMRLDEYEEFSRLINHSYGEVLVH